MNRMRGICSPLLPRLTSRKAPTGVARARALGGLGHLPIHRINLRPRRSKMALRKHGPTPSGDSQLAAPPHSQLMKFVHKHEGASLVVDLGV